MDEVTKRNNAALNDYVKSVEGRLNDMGKKIQLLEGTVATLQGQMIILQQSTNINLAQSFNGGPTAR